MLLGSDEDSLCWAMLGAFKLPAMNPVCSMCGYIYIYICIILCMDACACMYVGFRYVCMHVRMYVCVCCSANLEPHLQGDVLFANLSGVRLIRSVTKAFPQTYRYKCIYIFIYIYVCSLMSPKVHNLTFLSGTQARSLTNTHCNKEAPAAWRRSCAEAASCPSTRQFTIRASTMGYHKVHFKRDLFYERALIVSAWGI